VSTALKTRFPWPTALTTTRLLLVPVFLCLLLQPANANHRRLALAVFLIMAITDKLDGTLARRLNMVTTLGTLLDPIADKLLISGSFIILVFPRYAPAGFAIPWPILWGVYQKDLCVLIGALIVKRTVGKVKIHASQPGKINTVMEVALVIATLLAPEWIAISPAFAAFFFWSLWHLTVLATAVAAIDYSMEGSRQLRAFAKSKTMPDVPTTPFNPA
jgi:cardiolipin synthase